MNQAFRAIFCTLSPLRSVEVRALPFRLGRTFSLTSYSPRVRLAVVAAPPCVTPLFAGTQRVGLWPAPPRDLTRAGPIGGRVPPVRDILPLARPLPADILGGTRPVAPTLLVSWRGPGGTQRESCVVPRVSPATHLRRWGAVPREVVLAAAVRSWSMGPLARSKVVVGRSW